MARTTLIAEQAMAVRGLAAGVAGRFGREPVIGLVSRAEFEPRVAGDLDRGGQAF